MVGKLEEGKKGSHNAHGEKFLGYKAKKGKGAKKGRKSTGKALRGRVQSLRVLQKRKKRGAT